MIRGKQPEADLRRGYNKTLWISVGSSALLNAVLILFYPTLEPDALTQPQKPILIQLEKIPETRQERRPPPPPRPLVPIATDDPDLPDDVTIESTDLDLGLDDLLPPPPLEEFEEEIELEEEEEEVVDIWKVEKEPQPIGGIESQPKPKYPEIAQKAGIEGRVFVKVLVGKDGKVEQIGEISGPEVFHEVARAAALQWTFSPAIQNDKPVRVWVSLPFVFKLK
jgi:protein TonB